MKTLEVPEDRIPCPDDIDLVRERNRFVAAVHQGLADAEAGRLVDDEELGAILDAEFGPLT